MLVRVISFDIHDFNANVTESFVIPDTIENQEFVFTHRYTRNIRFGKMFDFELAKTLRMPAEMISNAVWLALLPEMEKELAEIADSVEIDIALDDPDADTDNIISQVEMVEKILREQEMAETAPKSDATNWLRKMSKN